MALSHTPDPGQTRTAVTTRYSGLARAARAGEQVTDCDPGPFAAGCFGAAGYADTGGLPDGALRASLGCGNPVAVAGLHPGETVLDLGSGGGIDVLLSARRVAPGGKAYGLDGSADMITLARENAAQAGVTNAEFLHGHIEDIPLPDGHADVVISNCVINLSADKPRVLAEAFRVLRPGGRLGISDVIANDGLDPAQRAEAGQRAGCSTGTLTAAEYRTLLLASGFTSIQLTATAGAEPGLRSAIIQATRPGAPPGFLIRPMRDVRHEAQGRGIGAALLHALIGSTEAAGIWTIQTGIFPENTTSLRLHQRAGFRIAGIRQRIGCHHGHWRDVALLERRSPITGN